MDNNQIFQLVGMIIVWAAAYKFANSGRKENEKLRKRVKENDSIIMFDNQLLTEKTEKIEELTGMLEQEKKQSKRLEKRIELNMTKASDRFAKDQITIDKLEEMNKARYSETEYLRREKSKLKKCKEKLIEKSSNLEIEKFNLEQEIGLMTKIGYRKIFKASKLGGTNG